MPTNINVNVYTDPNIFEPYLIMALYKQNKTKSEVDLLIHCARKEVSEYQLDQIQKLFEAEINWEIFINLVFNHGVATLVYRSLNQYSSQVVPDPILAQLRNHFMINAQTNLSLFKELLNTIDFLKQHNITCIPFKGLISAELIYRDLSLRKCGDIDILVRATDFRHAKQLFINEGFIQTLPDQAEIDYLQSGLFNEDRKLNIDLHYGIPPKSSLIKVNKLFKDTTCLSIHNKQINTFSRIDMFLVICINATKEYWNQKLYQYCDINEFLLTNNDIDLNLIVKRAKNLRCKRMLFIALLVTNEIYDTPLPEIKGINDIEPIQAIKQELLKQIFPDDIYYENKRYNMFILESEEEFFTGIMDSFYVRAMSKIPKLLTPNKNDFELIKLPQNLYPLYYLLKPFRVLISRTWKGISKIFT